VAASIASGRGFSSPLALVQTGPTAWLCPIFPQIIAAIFRVWGIFTFKSLAAIQILNCLFVSLTIFPIYSIAKRSFGTGVALLASWLWAFLPSAIHVPVFDVWDTSLTALLFALTLWATLEMRDKDSPLIWAGYGALWATGALVNAAVLSVFPFFLVWLAGRRRPSRASTPGLVTLALVAFILLLAPWTIRNYRVFGRFVPLRSAFGLVLWLGNNPRAMEFTSFPNHPFTNPSEAADFKRLGEMAYMDQKKREAVAFIKSHPDQSLKFFARRVVSNWFSVSDRPNESWATDPVSLKAYAVFNAALVVLAWLGMLFALRSQNPDAPPYLIVLLAYPLLYYLTGTLFRYRFPMEPLLTVLSVYGADCSLAKPLGLEFLRGRALMFGRTTESSESLGPQRFSS